MEKKANLSQQIQKKIFYQKGKVRKKGFTSSVEQTYQIDINLQRNMKAELRFFEPLDHMRETESPQLFTVITNLEQFDYIVIANCISIILNSF